MRRMALATLGLALGAFPALPTGAQVSQETLESLSAPDKVETSIGTLEPFFDKTSRPSEIELVE
jgi:hypothetical protein